MTSAQFPLPVPSPDNQEFFDKCREHQLVLRRCRACHLFSHPPRPNCPDCGSDNLEWVKSEGKGTVYTFTITRQPVSRAFQGRIPWAVVEVELEEGVHMISNLVDFDPEAIEIGIAVEVVFEEVDDEITLPKFKVVASK